MHSLQVASGKELRDVSGHRYGVTDVRFSADGQYILATGRDAVLRICQTSDGKEGAAMAISPDQSSVAATDIAGIVHVWSL